MSRVKHMLVVTFEISVFERKRREFIQAVPGILVGTSKNTGCMNHHMSQDLQDENRFFVTQTWESQSQLDAYWRSERFGMFMGSFHLMKRAPTVKIHAVSFTAGIEAVKAARAS